MTLSKGGEGRVGMGRSGEGSGGKGSGGEVLGGEVEGFLRRIKRRRYLPKTRTFKEAGNFFWDRHCGS